MAPQAGWEDTIAGLLDRHLFNGGVTAAEAAAVLGVSKAEAQRVLESFPQTPAGKSFARENDVSLNVLVVDGDITLRPDARYQMFGGPRATDAEA
ncbi:MAG: hypothetical protein ACT4PT_06480 [Methanobacteriota archaeon]